MTSVGPASVGSIVDLPPNEALLNISNNKARLAPPEPEPAADPEPTLLVCEAPPVAPPVEVKRSTRQSRTTKE